MTIHTECAKQDYIIDSTHVATFVNLLTMNEIYSQIFHLLFYKVVAGKARIETKIAIQMSRKEKLLPSI